MINIDQARMLAGKKLLGQNGENLGTIDTLYADREDGEPTFATVHTGLFGSRTSFVPLSQANLQGEYVVVPYDEDFVKGAPYIDQDSELSPEEEQQLYSHYGLSGSSSTATTGTTDTTGEFDRDRDVATGTTGVTEDRGLQAEVYDTIGPITDDAMTRSEERVNVGTERVESGRARLRKYIVTENVSVRPPGPPLDDDE